ncbi:MAG: hypothetical protein MJ245_04510 [Clostridia bacterium]|nr:hypothetical protein [Clostridia bacterium]
MDNLDRLFSGMINNEKEFATSKLNMMQFTNQMEDGINKSADWLYKNDNRLNKIGSEYGMIKKSEFDMIKKEIR